MVCEKGDIISISMLIKVTFAEIRSLEEKSVAFTVLCWETVGDGHTCNLISSVLRRLTFGEYANRNVSSLLDILFWDSKKSWLEKFGYHQIINGTWAYEIVDFMRAESASTFAYNQKFITSTDALMVFGTC